jgi:hypothetical protein
MALSRKDSGTREDARFKKSLAIQMAIRIDKSYTYTKPHIKVPPSSKEVKNIYTTKC